MPRDGAILFGDLTGKLDDLRVSCHKCGRFGRYPVQRLIKDRGREGKIVDWLGEITADCPKKSAHNMSDQCGAKCPDLPKVFSGSIRRSIRDDYWRAIAFRAPLARHRTTQQQRGSPATNHDGFRADWLRIREIYTHLTCDRRAVSFEYMRAHSAVLRPLCSDGGVNPPPTLHIGPRKRPFFLARTAKVSARSITVPSLLYPKQRTFRRRRSMSAKCQKRTSRRAPLPASCQQV